MKSIIDALANDYINLKDYITAQASSEHIYSLSWFLVAVMIFGHWYFGQKLNFSIISVLVACTFSIGFVMQLVEQAKQPNTIMGRITRFKSDAESTLVYKAILLFLTSILTALAYMSAQKIVALTMAMSPELFFNSVALITPLIWLFFAFGLVLSILGLSMVCMMLWAFIKSMAEQAKFIFTPLLRVFLSLFYILNGKEDKAEELVSKSVPTKTDIRSMTPVLGAVCSFCIVSYFAAFYEKVLFSDEYIEFRKGVIVSLDYYGRHSCENEIGKGLLVNYIKDGTVSVARKEMGEWKIETKNCLQVD